MATLLDIGPLTEEVEVRGVKLTVHGLSAGNLFKLMSSVPDARKLIGAGSAEALVQMAPELMAKVIAMVTGSPNDAKAEAKARELGAADQIAILRAVQRLSFPEGLGPFFQQMNELMGQAPALPSNISSSATTSPAPSSAALQTDTPRLARGTIRRAN